MAPSTEKEICEYGRILEVTVNQKIKSKYFLLNTVLIVLVTAICIPGCEENSAGNTYYTNDWHAIKIDYTGAPNNSSWTGTPFRFNLNALVSGLNSADFDESNIVIIPRGAYKRADSDGSIEESVFAYWEVVKAGEDYFADATVTDAGGIFPDNRGFRSAFI